MPVGKVATLGSDRKLTPSQLPAPSPGTAENPLTDVNAVRPNFQVVYWQVDYAGPNPTNAAARDIILPLT